jgi:VIT1/CCC1 family predicted Fe2+/Mn2+ transporter
VHAAASKLCQSSRPLLLAAKKPAAPKPIPLARHMRGIVFGGMDGILTTFALLAAVAGSGGTSPALTLVIGISTVLADGLSMGAGEYLSAKAEAEIATGGDEEETTPLEKGFAMFVAFTLFGAMPLLGFLLTELLASGTGPGPGYHFQLSVAITAFTLFALGTVKSTFGAGTWWKAGGEVTIVGGAAACVAFYTAKLVDFLVSKSGALS